MQSRYVNNLPLVSIVTPSYNSEQFIAETIESVLAQDYPAVEYIVMDAQSTDGTAAIVSRYAERLQFHSAPDRGVADAVNAGIRLARGEIVAFLNSDDKYLPGAIGAAVDALTHSPELVGVYGNAYWIDGNGAILRPYPTEDFDPKSFELNCFISQPAVFFRRDAFEKANGFDISFHSAFDYDFWIRLSHLGKLERIHSFWALSRMHPGNKTLGNRRIMFSENFRLLLKHFGYVPLHWICGFTCFLADGRDQFFEPAHMTRWRYLLSLGIGLRTNWRHPLRYTLEWLRGIHFTPSKQVNARNL